MTLLTMALEALVLLLCLALVVVLGFVVRRRMLQRGAATFDCSLRETLATHGRGWTLGLARYGDDRIEWFRVFSWSPRPKRTFWRAQLQVRGRRRPTAAEAFAVAPNAVVVQCAFAGRMLEFAMDEAALTGLLAWLEASPPGRHVRIA